MGGLRGGRGTAGQLLHNVTFTAISVWRSCAAFSAHNATKTADITTKTRGTVACVFF